MRDTNMGVGQYYDSPEEKETQRLTAERDEWRKMAATFASNSIIMIDGNFECVFCGSDSSVEGGIDHGKDCPMAEYSKLIK